MAEALAQQNTLQAVLDQLKVANELRTGHSVKTERVGDLAEQQTDKISELAKDSLKTSLGAWGGIKGSISNLSKIQTSSLKSSLGSWSGIKGSISNLAKITTSSLKSSLGSWDGMKNTLMSMGKTLRSMSLISGLQWAMQKREGKGSKLMEFAKGAVKPMTDGLKKGVGKIMDWLGNLGKLGLFLAGAGLLELFTNKKWQEFLKKMWQDMVDKVKEWWEQSDFKKIFDDFKTKFLAWYNDTAKPVIDKIIGWFEGDMATNLSEMGTKFESWSKTWNELRLAAMALNIVGWFGPGSPLKIIFGLLKTIFGFDTPLDEAGKAGKVVKNAGMFGKEGSLMKMWNGLKTFFGAEGTLANKWKLMKEGATFTKWFGADSTLGRMFQSFKNFFGAEGKIATMWKTIKEGAGFQKLFGEGSTLGKLFTSIKGFFGPESAMGKAAKWIGDLVKPIKEMLTGGAKGGGAISKVFGIFNWVFDGIKGVGKTIAKIAGPVLKLMGKGLTIAATIAKPFSFLMWPITAILAAGAAVWGFVKGFMGTEGSIGDKIIGGFKGALQGLIDFFVVDIAVMIQDVLNWFLEKIPGASKVIDKFTFGDDLKQASDSFIGKMVDATADGFGIGKGGEIDAKSLAKSDFIKAGLGKVEDAEGVGTGDKLVLDQKKLAKYMDAMSINQLKGLGSDLADIEGAKGMKVENMAAIQKQLMLKLTEKADAAQAAQLAIQNNSPTKNIKQDTIVASQTGTESLVKTQLLELVNQ